MRPLFFPDPVFGWVFCLVLIGFTAVAAYTDLKKAIIPNKLTVTMLAVGVVFGLIRGGWLGAANLPLAFLGTGNVWLGLADGLLVSLLGFVLAFAVMFVMWVLGASGGGDLKLFAAIGAWLGWLGFVSTWIASLPLLFVWMFARVLFGYSTLKREKRKVSHVNKPVDSKGPPKSRTRTTYSLPILVALVAACLWLYRIDLHLVSQPAPPANTGTTTDGTPTPNTDKDGGR